MNDYLQDLFNAFKAVSTDYYFTEALKDPNVILDGSINRQTFIQLTERHFCAELYFKWRQIITTNEHKYLNLKVGFEVSKKFVDNELVKNKALFTPDMVLHQSQIHFHPEFQKIYVEIKTNPSLNLKRIKHDLNKILFAMNQYGFQQGVFISINSDFDRLLKLIRNYMIKIENRDISLKYCWSNFYLFHSDENGNSQKKSFEEIGKISAI